MSEARPSQKVPGRPIPIARVADSSSTSQASEAPISRHSAPRPPSSAEA